MLEKVNAYLRKIPFPTGLFKGAYGNGVCSISITPHELSLCHLLSVGGELQIQLCDSIPYEENSLLRGKLTKFVKANKLDSVSTSWVLRPSHYQAILTEALPVSAAEFQTAIRWKIKESLSMPLEDAVIDKYDIPEGKLGADNKMIVVVAARKSYIQPYLSIIKESGLKLTTIDTTELALHNLTAMYEEDDKTSALIYVEEKKVLLLITYHQKLFFSRYIDINLTTSKENMEEYNNQLDHLILEIQRSFDYFQSQWRLPLPTRIFLAGIKDASVEDAEIWTRKLSMPVELFDINNVLSAKYDFPISMQGKFLPLLGGVLRGYVEVHETTS